MNKYPIYKASVKPDDELSGMFAVSLVEFPAVEKDFVCFSEQEKKMNFKVENEEQRIVSGLIMCADTPIYRIDEYGNPFYIVFDRETIKTMAMKFMKAGFNNNVDLNHDFNYIAGVDLLELYIKDTARGISPIGFEDVNDGSLFGSYHVTDDEIWNEIKEGTYKGFSIEINCGIVPDMTEEERDFAEIEELITKIKEKISK